jgi:hypothetical protein
MYKRVITFFAVAAIPIAVTAGQAAAASSSPTAGRSSAGVAHVPRAASTRRVLPLRASHFQPRFPAQAVTTPTVPYYSDKFKYGGKTYPYSSVGTDPRTSTATTKVPVTFIPVKILEANGAYTYPTGAIIGKTTSSALFNNSTATGGTQYGDATLRASYNSYVKALGGKWHVLLGSPSTTALQTINVPSNEGTTYGDSAGKAVMAVNVHWYGNTLASLAAKYSAKALVIFLTYDAVGCSNYTNPKTCGVGGFHSDTTTSTGTHTYAWASWQDTAVLGASGADTAAMSHEIAEWLNDPFDNDIVPKWAVPSEPQYGCSHLLEVGDPLVGHVFTINGLNYQDVADFSWFARQSPSIGSNGWYSYRGTFRTSSPSC